MSGRPKSKNKSKKELNELRRKGKKGIKLHGPNRPST